MEKHKCKLCFRSFSNGRALGGHMRSHMMSLPIPPKLDVEDPPPPPPTPAPAPAPAELSEEADSASSSSSSEEEAEDEKELYYGLRENPKRSIRLGDPEFSFAAGTIDAASSVILQDRESETESSKNPTRRRSKRTRRFASTSSDHYWQYHHNQNKTQVIPDSYVNHSKKIKSSESEPLSSVSDATTDEDIAFCLMMLSRDNWTREEEEEEEEEQGGDDNEQEDHEDEEESSENESEELLKSSKNTRTRGKYKCDTCYKVFKSYQALGGHRASHKKIKICSPVIDENTNDHQSTENAGTGISITTPQKKIHECPVCFRVFSSGQALGGHKRSHVITATTTSVADHSTPLQLKTARTVVDDPSVICTSTTTTTKKSLNKLGEISFIDLNLPAPDDHDQDDEISQIELSAVSDAEFVNPIR